MLLKELGLPVSASLADTRVMVDGKLAEEHELRNVQVDVIERGPGVRTIKLRDENGMFLEIPAGGELGEERESGRAEAKSRESSEDEPDGARDDSTSREELLRQLRAAHNRAHELETELGQARQSCEYVAEEVSRLNDKVKEEKDKYMALWRMNCEQLSEYDEAMASRDEELQALRGRVEMLEAYPRSGTPPRPVHDGSTGMHISDATGHAGRGVAGVAVVPVSDPGRDLSHPLPSAPHTRGGAWSVGRHRTSCPAVTGSRDGSSRRGKAPPIDAFDGESPDVLFEDWLPALQRAAEWNAWSKEEALIQLAGHLRGRALQEWNLLSGREKESLDEVTKAMRSRLDPCSRALAAQDFRHALQRDNEPVPDFIRRLEQLFKLAYGRDGMSEETRGTLLHSQLQEGLHYEIMKAPAVSGSHGYQELCLAARNEEKRLVELDKRRQYHRPSQALMTKRTTLPLAGTTLSGQTDQPKM